jgi:hypothetical protein
MVSLFKEEIIGIDIVLLGSKSTCRSICVLGSKREEGLRVHDHSVRCHFVRCPDLR